MGKLGMLSSQPKRSWGDASPPPSPPRVDQNTRPASAALAPKSSFNLTEEDWPPTPPQHRPGKANAAAAAAAEAEKRRVEALKRAKVGPAGAAAAGKGKGKALPAVVPQSKPLAPKPSFTQQRGSPGQLAPLFRKSASTSSSANAGPSTSSSTLRSTSSASAAYAFNHASSSRTSSSSSGGTGSVLPKKRTLPWEELESSSSSSKVARGGSTSFHTLSGPAGGGGQLAPGMKEALLRSGSANIKQKVLLSPEQQMVLKLVVQDEKNVFFTGSAGTGKSVLLREIIRSLKEKYRGNTDAVAVTASTGMAACNIGGTTIHSFAGIGIGAGTAEQLVNNIKRNRNANAKWQRVKVLVVDEVSMVDGILFDKLAQIAASLKKRSGSKGAAAASKPFGGVQLVVTGDFFQLPPVTKGTTPTFAFEAAAWKQCIDHTVNLTQVFRQKDTEFIDMLNEMRFGRLTQESIKKFYALSRTPSYPVGIEPTELFPMRSEVDRANENRLRALRGEEHIFLSDDGPKDPNQDPSKPPRNKSVLDSFMAPEKLVLKVGAQVMLIKNLDLLLVNGTVGTVVAFGLPELDADGDDGEEEFVDAEGEVIKVKRELSAADARKKAKIAADVASGKMELQPVVEWQTPQGVERKIMAREEFKTEDSKGEVVARRRQYPLILAWAMSIHKSQGQTIERVKVDLGKVFEKGQSYVALSRATSLAGLQVLRFDPKKVAAHDKVVTWSRSLQVLG
ncbi:hypothetical protein JCM10207_006936 [Rhodosporidiobolus poonsookiae]